MSIRDGWRASKLGFWTSHVMQLAGAWLDEARPSVSTSVLQFSQNYVRTASGSNSIKTLYTFEGLGLADRKHRGFERNTSVLEMKIIKKSDKGGKH